MGWGGGTGQDKKEGWGLSGVGRPVARDFHGAVLFVETWTPDAQLITTAVVSMYPVWSIIPDNWSNLVQMDNEMRQFRIFRAFDSW